MSRKIRYAECHPDRKHEGRGLCLKCYTRVRQNEANARNPEQHAANHRRWRQSNPESYLLTTARWRSKKRGVECTIRKEDVFIPETCPILGIPLIPSFGKQHTDNSPTLDRIDPAKGYVPGNVAVISHRANIIKSFGTLEEHSKIVNWMREKLNPTTED